MRKELTTEPTSARAAAAATNAAAIITSTLALVSIGPPLGENRFVSRVDL
jgi:hypothetical protein